MKPKIEAFDADHPLFSPKSFEPPEREACLVSCSVPCAGVSPADFLRHAKGMERFLWEDGCQDIAFAGFGVTANLMAWGEDRFRVIQRQARELFDGAILFSQDQPLAGPRLFGGFAFRDDFTPDNTWSVFNPAHFILPHFQLTKVGEQTWLTINALLPPEEKPDESLPQLLEALEIRAALLQGMEAVLTETEGGPEQVTVNYPMPFSVWEQKINDARQHMGSSELNKVVLSRVCEIRFESRINVDSALAYLSEHYANCYRFLFEPRPFHAFYGATPELLAEVKGRCLSTMALAGSVRRGSTAAEDELLADQLLADPKERYEHALVVEAVRRRLRPAVDALSIPAEPAAYKLRNIQHLFTPITAELRQADGVLPVLELLHPTPALGGTPRDIAMAFIREAEPVPRGWYAAPVGTIDCNLDGTFGVAIRSAVSQEQRVWLYAGAGIVADSVPQKEWDETGLKFKPMLNALHLDLEAQLP